MKVNWEHNQYLRDGDNLGKNIHELRQTIVNLTRWWLGKKNECRTTENGKQKWTKSSVFI